MNINIPEGFVVGTTSHIRNSWPLNPIGFRIVAKKAEPAVRNDIFKMVVWSSIEVELFKESKVCVVFTFCGPRFNCLTLQCLLAGHDFFPAIFSQNEIAKLEEQLKIAKNLLRK